MMFPSISPMTSQQSSSGPEKERFLFTSESVCEGHPDKMCDIISDSVLDECLRQDPQAKVACETITKTGFVHVVGEVSTSAEVDYQTLIRKVITEIGYKSSEDCLDGRWCHVGVSIQEQSPDIAHAVYINKPLGFQGAGDSGIIFGYASDETPEMMPMTILYAHRLAQRLAEVRKNGICKGLGPDGKTQITIEYERDGPNIKPIRVHNVVISAMHKESVSIDQLRKMLIENVIEYVIPPNFIDENTKFFVNPGGRFVIGGPAGDAGLTGRKVIIDSYGGWGSNGGGALSGKDPSKVDRSGSYTARWIAKSIVAAGLAHRCVIELSYAIGIPEPLSVSIDTYGTSAKSNEEILEIVKDNFDLKPYAMIKELKLLRPIYAKTACYGHFGRNDPDFTWEVPKKIQFS